MGGCPFVCNSEAFKEGLSLSCLSDVSTGGVVLLSVYLGPLQPGGLSLCISV